MAKLLILTLLAVSLFSCSERESKSDANRTNEDTAETSGKESQESKETVMPKSYGSAMGASWGSIHDSGKLTREQSRKISKQIYQKLDELQRLGRISGTQSNDGYLVSSFQWFNAEADVKGGSTSSSSSGEKQVGIYVFDEAVFNQSKRSWFANVTIDVGSDTLEALGINFDETVVGFSAFIAGIEEKPVRVVEFIDAHRVRLSIKVKSKIDGYVASIVAPDYDQNLCGCVM